MEVQVLAHLILAKARNIRLGLGRQQVLTLDNHG